MVLGADGRGFRDQRSWGGRGEVREKGQRVELPVEQPNLNTSAVPSNQMQRELTSRRAEGADFKEGGLSAPRSPRSPRSPSAAAAARSRSESDAAVPEDVPGARARLKAQTESLFLDALSLDPMGGLGAPAPCRLDSEKRFPCMKEASVGVYLIPFSTPAPPSWRLKGTYCTTRCEWGWLLQAAVSHVITSGRGHLDE